jgi:hypothetical protein
MDAHNFGFYKSYLPPRKVTTLGDLDAFLKEARENGINLDDCKIYVMY